jgi:hypothetical protein
VQTVPLCSVLMVDTVLEYTVISVYMILNEYYMSDGML